MPIQLTLEMQSESFSLFITYSSCLKILSRVIFYSASISGLSNQLKWLLNFAFADWIKLVNFKNNHTYEYGVKLKKFQHKSQLNSDWIYEVIVSSKIPTKNYRDYFLPYLLIIFQGRNPSNFWLAFWDKRWPHKFILNLTDLYHAAGGTKSFKLNT